MNDIGEFTLLVALATAIYGCVAYVMAARGNRVDLYLSADKTPLIVWGCVMISSICLWRAFLVNDFSLQYVWAYSNIELDTFYKIASFWGGQKGSLLFWTLLLSTYTVVVHFQNRKKNLRVVPYAMAVLLVIIIFFLFLINFSTNPFERIPLPPEDGRGLNPLLQNYWMVIHPPTLYLGYVGFTVPFAFAVAALISKNLDDGWIRVTRKWTLISWFFLCMGNLFGASWAYVELGWGGYWAWDPVENASFMPWLTATAFVHSIIIQEKKDMLRVWNMVLIILTFTLCIFGTFLTRSGVMSSVHSFTASSLGPIFLAFVFFILIASFGLMYTRINDLRSTKRMESFTSRESGFLFNNMVFVVMCFSVFWGTLFPVISEAVRGTKITVGPPFFNQINIPIGLILLGLTGVGPLLAWRRTGKKNLIRNFTFPILTGLSSAIILLIIGFRDYVVISFSLGAFVTATITTEFIRGIRARNKKFKESPFVALKMMVSKNRSRYGGYVVHLGIVFMFIGFTGHAFDKEKEFSLKEGETDHVAGYEFELIQLSESERPNHYAWISDLRVTNHNGEFVTNLNPEKRVYFHRNPDVNRRQPHSELDIYSTLNKDIYSIFSAVDTENGVAFIKIMVNPLVRWVWIGGFILVFGTLIALWPRRDS